MSIGITVLKACIFCSSVNSALSITVQLARIAKTRLLDLSVTAVSSYSAKSIGSCLGIVVMR